MKTKRLTRLSLCCALALVLSFLESLVPAPVLPGMKLGLANLVVLTLLFVLPAPQVALVSAVRLGLSTLLFGSPVSLSYGAAGAVCSFAVMWGLKKAGRFSPAVVSMAGGVTHNAAQVAVAALMFRQAAVVSLLPWLWLAGIVSGLVVGLLGALMIPRVEKLCGGD